MRFIVNFIYFIVFICLALVAMFLGGVSGVAGSFYLMVKEGSIADNLHLGIAALAFAFVLLLILRGQNKKVMKQRELEHVSSADDSQNEGYHKE